ncbi:hypothetical protein Pcinc_028097 [Petrolisthes cinctipes]|uniref:Uncharacterized protein n=1 Tax=Petrolisthes cinctipes TaxID=88211 RepID=A0AAE1K7R3_PETCI|nr:hypothetical protein Pcinc_028097 [Petrolisthes cinctipes]
MVAPGEFSDLSRSLVRVPGSGSDRSAAPSTCDLGTVSSLAATVQVNPRLPAIITNPRGAASSPPAKETETAVTKLGMKPIGPMRNARARPVPSQPYTVPQRNEGDQAPQNTSTTVQGATTIPFPLIPPAAPTSVRLPADFFSNRQGRIRALTPQELVNHASSILHVNTQAGPVLLMPVRSEGSKLHKGRFVTKPSVPARKVAQTGVKEANTGLQESSVSVMTLEQFLEQQDNLKQENAQLHQQINRYRQLFRNPEKLKALMRQLGIMDSQN